MNAYRLYEQAVLVRKVRKASNEGLSMDWLLPFMTKRQVQAGQILFRKGQAADEMFIVSSGRLRLSEIGVELLPGGVVGELGYIGAPPAAHANARVCSKTPKSCRSTTIALSRFIFKIRASVSIYCVLRVRACFRILPSLKKNWNSVAWKFCVYKRPTPP